MTKQFFDDSSEIQCVLGQSSKDELSIQNMSKTDDITEDVKISNHWEYSEGDQIVSMSLNGSILLEVLKDSVRSNCEMSFGKFSQPSGLHYSFNGTIPVGSRILEAKARCRLWRTPFCEPLVLEKTHRIVTL
ncbi:hypothetical protein FQA39_LY02087 [Lamprigera yunnana]|nr:hypothetical protein FQA39_LY02087 [Lamprigera yunnana]